MDGNARMNNIPPYENTRLPYPNYHHDNPLSEDTRLIQQNKHHSTPDYHQTTYANTRPDLSEAAAIALSEIPIFYTDPTETSAIFDEFLRDIEPSYFWIN